MSRPRLEHRLCLHLWRHLRRYLLLALALFLFWKALQFAGGWEAGKLESNYLQFPAEALPGAGSMRIAFLADIHDNPALLKQSVELVREAQPDLIILGGDYVTAGTRFKRTRRFILALRELAAIAPTYAILGNHDYEKLEQVERVLHTAGIPLLRNEARDWQTPSGATLRLIALGDWNEGDEAPERCMRPVGQEEHPVLLLSHDPESRWLLRSYDWDLMLSGHTHGGQLGLPFTHRYLSLRSSMPAGLFDFEGGRRVFVTRGVGAIMGMRFFCRPEVNIIDIQPAATPAGT